MRIIDYLPIEYIFNLLCVSRRIYRTGEFANTQMMRTSLKRRGLRSVREVLDQGDDRHIEGQGDVRQSAAQHRPIPRVSFWQRLCQAASLLDEHPTPYPTLLVEEWLSWPFVRQISHLFEAWVQAPGGEKYRRMRRELLQRLFEGVGLGVSHRQELVGLQTLGICEGERLTKLGMVLLEGSDKEQFIDPQPAPWILENEHLFVPFPPAWAFLWQLENYIDPSTPGVYSMDKTALRLAAQRSAIEAKPPLVDILERGLGDKPPAWLIERLAAQPTIRIIPGPVLEFTHPEELKGLREFPSLRRELEHLLSSRHAALDPWRAHRVLQQLHSRGLLSERELSNVRLINYPIGRLPDDSTRRLPDHLTKSDRVYLLSLMLLAEGLENVAAQPPGLLARLTEKLDYSLHAAAARKATAMLEQIRPLPPWKPEEEPPPLPSEELIMAIQGAIDREESIDVLYKASGRHSAEYRHLSPLLVEQRGERFYLIAYCHTRRANRTFRLDRLKLIDFPPQ
jgi:hypothetical protein